MHILVSQTRLKTPRGGFTPDRLQTGTELISLISTNHAAFRKHAGMGDGTVEVLLQKRDVKTDGGIETLNRRMKALIKTIAPCGGASARHSPSHTVISTLRAISLSGHGRALGCTLQDNGLGTDGNITASGTFKTTIEASSSNWRSMPTNRSKRVNS